MPKSPTNMAERVYKITLLGNEGVGKTALLVRFLSQRFIGEYDPTIEDCYRRTVKVDGEDVTLDILDTACRSSTSKLKDTFLSTGDGFIVIYSIVDRRSYITVPRYKEMIEESRDRGDHRPLPFLLIGNKVDLEEHRTVAKNEGQALANRYEWLFHEASAAEYDGVDKSFCDLIRQIRAQRRVICSPDFASSCSDIDSQDEEGASEGKKRRKARKKLSDSSINYKRKLFGPWHHS